MAIVPSLPARALAVMVPVIKGLIIMVADPVVAPIGVVVVKMFPIDRMGLIPGVPSRSVPMSGPDNIGRRIGIIRGPAILWAKKVIQDAI